MVTNKFYHYEVSVALDSYSYEMKGQSYIWLAMCFVVVIDRQTKLQEYRSCEFAKIKKSFL